MIYADRPLACRLESLICAEYRHLASVARKIFPYRAAECIEVAEGVALWLGDGSPVNGAVGMAMRGPVGEEAFERLEGFFHDRGAPAVMGMCPLADPSLLHMLGHRGWTASEFENVLALELDKNSAELGLGAAAGAAAPPAGLEVRVCLPEERETWGQAAARGFDAGAPEPAHEEFGRIMVEKDDAILVLARVDGRPAGTGALVVDGGVGWLSGDSTFPGFRGRGIQQAVQRHRLELARAAGCDLAVTEAAPGSQSQRNMERLGFRIVYTHVEFTKSA
jgi:GNAT superfamily N-acetyltransferase